MAFNNNNNNILNATNNGGGLYKSNAFETFKWLCKVVVVKRENVLETFRLRIVREARLFVCLSSFSLFHPRLPSVCFQT